MSEEDEGWHSRWKPDDVLRGWSEGDEERPVPGPEEYSDGLLAEARKYWRQPEDAASRQVPYEDQLTEFPLYYAKGRRSRDYWARSYNQLQAVSDRAETSALVLTITKRKRDSVHMLVISANNIWKLLWLYVKAKFRRQPKRKSKIKLPKYG